ncbi:hypothetical protein AB5J62_33655 [Amycolatopsis sp. cg5]|uniref:hypothetical protein n=1 Tax=Amycolatopsis sp. cg5 TaxID=3238802 RepID=UPI0035243369
MIDTTGRHPSTAHIARFFRYGHLGDDEARTVSMRCSTFAEAMIDALPDGPELTAGLRHLLEAKDCFVRAALPEDD